MVTRIPRAMTNFIGGEGTREYIGLNMSTYLINDSMAEG